MIPTLYFVLARWQHVVLGLHGNGVGHSDCCIDHDIPGLHCLVKPDPEIIRFPLGEKVDSMG